MIFEKDVGKAIDVLRDICCIIPPLPINDLSYRAEDTIYSKKSGLAKN